MHANKIRLQETKKPEESDAISEVEHRHGNSFTSLPFAHVNKLIIYFTMHKQKTLIYKLSHSKASKHGKFRSADIYEKNQWTFLWCRTGIDFNSCNNLANKGFFAKVSVPVESIIPWCMVSYFGRSPMANMCAERYLVSL